MSAPVDGTRRRPHLGTIVLSIVAVLALIALILELIPSNYYMLLPGQALPVESMIAVQGYPNHKYSGRLLMTDVTLYKVNHKLEEIYGRLNPNAELDPAQSFSGGLSQDQYLQLNDELMLNSVQQAEVAALEVARGYKLHFASKGPQVAFILPDLPASHYLRVGDIILSVDGQQVTNASSVAPLIQRLKPGQKVTMTIRRHGKTHIYRIPTVPSTNGEPAKNGKTPLIGIYVRNRLVLPVKISINSGNIGGPSAGLMFSLGIIQRLEHRDLARGCTVAGTGTINYQAKVGAIGGARQKVIAAERAGAKYFLVPANKQNISDARAAGGNIIIKPVNSLRQALNYLNHIPACH